MKRFIITLALSGLGACALALGLWPSAAHAFGFANFCCGDADFLDVSTLPETRNACTIGTSGNVASSYFSAINFWNFDSKIPVTASRVHVASECFIDLDDSLNEIALVNRNSISGFSGLTTYAHVNVCLCGNGGNYSNSDTRLANDLEFSNTDGQHAIANVGPTAPAAQKVGVGRVIVVHELGHQLGLNDLIGYAMMTTKNSSYPLSGDLNSHPQPFPDDIAGVRALYGTKANTNIFSTAQVPGGSGFAVDANPSPFFVCQNGGRLDTSTTIVNSGSTAVTYRTVVYLALQPNLPPSQATFVLNRFTTTIQPRTTQTFMTSAFGPFNSSSADLQGFFVLHAIDDNNKVTEANEVDNITTDGSVVVFGPSSGC